MASTPHEVDAQERFTVLAPFDPNSSGDCIIRTSDNSEFKIYHKILMLSSSVFADMFSMPQPAPVEDNSPGDSTDGQCLGTSELPTVHLSENSRAIDLLLRCIYPVPNPVITSLDLALALMLVAEKYFIPLNMLPLEPLLISKEILINDPIKAYSLAWRLGSKNAATEASQHTHAADLTNESIKRQITEFSGGLEALVALYELKMKRDAALAPTLACISTCWFLCQGCTSMSKLSFQYSEVLRNALKQALEDAEPHPRDICSFLKLKEMGFYPTVCPKCRRSAEQSFLAIPDSEASEFWARVKDFPKAIRWV